MHHACTEHNKHKRQSTSMWECQTIYTVKIYCKIQSRRDILTKLHYHLTIYVLTERPQPQTYCLMGSGQITTMIKLSSFLALICKELSHASSNVGQLLTVQLTCIHNMLLTSDKILHFCNAIWLAKWLAKYFLHFFQRIAKCFLFSCIHFNNMVPCL